MNVRCLRYAAIAAPALGLLCLATPAMATQTHGQPEGLYAHQIAHLFFIVSMGILEYWLRQRNLVREPGWKYIQVAAVLFILWNVDAMAVHFLDEQIDFFQVTILDEWHMNISASSGGKSLALLYYILKLDHLLCVPAMVCLYLGLKSLTQDKEKSKTPANPR
jgi:hypothetical protein